MAKRAVELIKWAFSGWGIWLLTSATLSSVMTVLSTWISKNTIWFIVGTVATIILFSAFTILVLRRRRIIRIPTWRCMTIQEGINKAKDGYTVLVSDGTYTSSGDKNLDFKGKRITVKSENGPQKVIIDCKGSGRGFYFHSREISESVVSGFTITNGRPIDGKGGGAIRCENLSSPTIENNIIIGNRAKEDGGGICCEQSRPVIQNNELVSSKH